MDEFSSKKVSEISQKFANKGYCAIRKALLPDLVISQTG